MNEQRPIGVADANPTCPTRWDFSACDFPVLYPVQRVYVTRQLAKLLNKMAPRLMQKVLRLYPMQRVWLMQQLAGLRKKGLVLLRGQ